MSLPASSSPQSSSATSNGVFVVVSMRKRFTQCASSRWTDPAMTPSPASGAQALDTLRSLAAADPSKQLRELAANLTTAVEEALGDAPLQRPGAAVDRTAEHPGGLTTPQKPPPVVVEVAPARGDVRLPR